MDGQIQQPRLQTNQKLPPPPHTHTHAHIERLAARDNERWSHDDKYLQGKYKIFLTIREGHNLHDG